MEKREQAYKDYKKGMKYKDIAEKYEVSISAVKSWAYRYWNNEKVATQNRKGLQPNEKKLQPKSRGAPKGNTNAIGNNGGAPKGNTNAKKHGAYSAVYWDTLDETERAMLEGVPTDEEQLLIEQIQLFSIRERRIMQAINKYKNINGGLAVSGVMSSHTKREFSNDKDKKRYEELKQKKVEEDKISYLGFDKFTQTTTEATISIIQRLENELTRIQRAKTQCIAELNKFRSENRRFEEDNKGDELVNDWINSVIGDDNE